MDNIKNGKAPVALPKDKQILSLTQEQAWAASLWDYKRQRGNRFRHRHTIRNPY